jgi:two-component system, LytTR family, response regulator
MKNYFFIKDNGKYVKISNDDILYIEGSRNYVHIITLKRKWVVLCTMKDIQAALPAHSFCRVHKSYIIAIDKISAFESSVIYLADKTIPIGEQYREQLLKKVLIISGHTANLCRETSCASLHFNPSFFVSPGASL